MGKIRGAILSQTFLKIFEKARLRKIPGNLDEMPGHEVEILTPDETVWQRS